MKIRPRNLIEFIIIWPVFLVVMALLPSQAGIDSNMRINAAQNATFDNIAVIFSEPAVLLLAKFVSSPEMLQLSLALLIIIICAFRYGYSSVWILVFMLTAPGLLLIQNIQPFFIASLLAMSVTEKLLNQEKLSYLDWIIAILAILFHWAALIVYLLEGLILFFSGRVKLKYKLLLIFSGSVILFAAYYYGIILLIGLKLTTYSGYTSGVAIHVYLSVIMFVIIATLNPFIKVTQAPASRAMVYSAFSLFFMFIGSVKLGSRMAFFSDIVFYFWAVSVFSHISRKLCIKIQNYHKNNLSLYAGILRST